MRESSQLESTPKSQTSPESRVKLSNAARRARRKSSNRESGYTLLMIMFIVASMLLLAVAATPSVVIEGRRAKEQEDVWRGNQYVRAIRLYYQKTGRYPQTIDDLTKADNAGNHFLRKTYTDLMNPVDGKWRFIYVSQSGQLIGSVRYHSLQEMAVAQGVGASLGTVAGGAGSGMATAGQTAQAGQSGQTGQPGSTTGFGATPVFGSSAQPQSLAPLEPVDGPVLGGFLIGVGGKAKTPSLMVYQGGKTYYDWEFIWNPLAAGGAIGTPVTAPGVPGTAGAAGTTPTGTGGTAAPGTNPDGTTNPAGTNNPVGTFGNAPTGGAPSGNTPTGSNPGSNNPEPANPGPANPAPANPDPNNPASNNSANPAAPANPADPNAPPATSPQQPR